MTAVLDVAQMARSTFYYNLGNDTKEKKDQIALSHIQRLPENIIKWRGNKAKAQILKQLFGVVINHKKVGRLCKAHGLLAQNRRKKHPDDYYKRKKEARADLPANTLDRNFAVEEKGKVFCTDVSYFKTTKGWLYLSVLMDLCGRKIVAYSMSKNNNEALVMEMMDTFVAKHTVKDVLLHSDQGSLYTSGNFKKILAEYGIQQSMSGKGNCWDNACVERFFGTVKVESGFNETLKTGLLSYDKLKKVIESFIDFYNNERIVKDLGWLTPAQFSA